MTGYRDCACRDCFEIAIGEDGALCHDCEVAGCSPDRPVNAPGFECLAPEAYGGSGMGCDACEMLAINGIPCHETGCPNVTHECRGCNATLPRGLIFCEDCA